MFKKLVPVIALALIAGPVLAADPPASGDQSATPATKTHKSHKHHSKSKSTKSSSSDTSSAPAK
jgi:hypothetical protein